MIYTTLNKIRSHSPCKEGWEKLLSTLGKTKADDDDLSLLTVLNSNGLDDALWCLRATEGHDREIRLFGVWCARQVQHLMTDQRSINAIDVAERFSNGNASSNELSAAFDAAWDAARAATLDEARDAARTAARGAALDAARTAAWDAARDAAWDAAWTATRTAAWDAVWTAAWTAAWDAVWDAQESEFRRMLGDDS